MLAIAKTQSVATISIVSSLGMFPMMRSSHARRNRLANLMQADLTGCWCHAGGSCISFTRSPGRTPVYGGLALRGHHVPHSGRPACVSLLACLVSWEGMMDDRDDIDDLAEALAHRLNHEHDWLLDQLKGLELASFIQIALQVATLVVVLWHVW